MQLHDITMCVRRGSQGTAARLAQRPAPGERATPMPRYRKAALMR